MNSTGYQNLKGHVSPDLEEWLGDQYVSESTFTNLGEYSDLLDRVEDLKERSASFFAPSGETRTEQPDALEDLDEWLGDTQDDIVRALQTPHEPLTTGALEAPLQQRRVRSMTGRIASTASIG